MQRIFFNFSLALEAVFANQLRTVLTALGIIFGVASVITMLAIGTGAQQSILEKMQLIGTNNIVVKGIVPNPNSDSENESISWSPGLTLNDINAVSQGLSTISDVSPEIEISTSVIRAGKLEKAKCIGTENSFFKLNNLKIGSGTFFHELHSTTGKPVCIIGKTIQTKFFGAEDPLGKKIKCGNTWLEIIGVLDRQFAKKENLENLGIRDYNNDIYVPIKTALIRFKNRALVSRDDIQSNFDNDEKPVIQNYHQLDKITFQVNDPEKIVSSSGIIGKILKRRHKGVVDFEIRVPEKELQAQQESQETWNNVLAFIAGISLLVGGIGIMNIMLASVLERIKEIGLRRSLGATRTDISMQFLFESVFISLVGGTIGVILGVLAAVFIKSNYEINTVIPIWSIILSFGVAVSVGVIFGFFPAQKAAESDPIKALRSD